MKCPNCASDVPDSSNFCGVCGFDVRSAREAATLAQQTMAMDSGAESQAIREELDAALASRGEAQEVSTDTVMDSAPSLEPEKTNVELDATVNQGPPSGAVRADKPGASTAPESPSFSPDVTTTQGVQINVSPSETFASMEAIEAPPGGFRETQWFMAAQDPDHIENIENVVPTDLEGQYKNSGDALDTQVREQFSLNVEQDSEAPRSRGGIKDSMSDIPITRPGPNKAIIGAVVALIVALAAYFATRS